MNSWTTRHLGSVSHIEMGQSPPSEVVFDDRGAGLPFLQGNAEFGQQHPTARLRCTHPPKVARAGDTLISVRAPVGALNRAEIDYCIGRGLAAVRFIDADAGFGHYALAHNSRQLHRVAQGTTFDAIGSADLRGLSWAYPPLPEQRRIAEILDTLDEAIRTTEALIAKLEHVKKGLLHDLLTRGIDDNGELRDPERHPEQFKDSPLGRIPRAWDVSTVGAVSDYVTSGSRGWARYYAERGTLFIRIGNLTRRSINLDLADRVYVDLPQNAEGTRTRVEPGDLLVSITADLGIIGCVPADIGEAYVNQHIALARLRTACLEPRWVAHYLSGIQGQEAIRRANDQGAKAGLNLPTIQSFAVAVAPMAEQKAIVAKLDSVDARISAEEDEAKKLLLLKTGLMDDLLSGRVRVSADAQEVPA